MTVKTATRARRRATHHDDLPVLLERLDLLRLKEALTWEQLALLVGVSRITLRQWVLGVHQPYDRNRQQLRQRLRQVLQLSRTARTAKTARVVRSARVLASRPTVHVPTSASTFR